MTDTFSDRNVSVVLTGEQWFALMAHLAGEPLSNKGVDILREAKNLLAEQVAAAAEGNPIETRIINKLLADVLAAGYYISVNDGEETTVRGSGDLNVIKAAMHTTDEDYLHIYSDATDGKRLGWIRLIYGNGVDLISDYSANHMTEALVSGATRLAEKIEAQS